MFAMSLIIWAIFITSPTYHFFTSMKKWVSLTINIPGLIGFTQQKYTHFFGKWVVLTHSAYCHTLYTLAKMGTFNS